MYHSRNIILCNTDNSAEDIALCSRFSRTVLIQISCPSNQVLQCYLYAPTMGTSVWHKKYYHHSDRWGRPANWLSEKHDGSLFTHVSAFPQPSSNFEIEYKTVKLEFSETEITHQEKGRKLGVFRNRQVERKTPVSVTPFFSKALIQLLRTITIIRRMILLGRKQIYSCDKN